MSAEKPEVGDIFFNIRAHKKLIVLFVRKHYQCLIENGGLVMRYEGELNKMLYLGKSKVNIADLFEVENSKTYKF